MAPRTLVRHEGLRTAPLLIILVLLGPACALDKYLADPDRFPGWKGELPGGSDDSRDPDEVGYGLLGEVRLW